MALPEVGSLLVNLQIPAHGGFTLELGAQAVMPPSADAQHKLNSV